MIDLDKNSKTYLYIQIADSIRQAVDCGAFAPGSLLPTESELCKTYGVSRYPMRQAMSILVKEGYLARVRGRGTFVNDPATRKEQAAPVSVRSQSIGICLPEIKDDFLIDILSGFTKTCAEHGYAAMLGIPVTPELEMDCIERFSQCGAAGIVVFPINGTLITEAVLNRLIADGLYISIMDRNPGLDQIDYVGSDNSGGGYLAARHMKLQGYGNAVFLSDLFHISSVQERFLGFKRGLKQYDLRLLNDELPQQQGTAEDGNPYTTQSFLENIGYYRDNLPFAVFTENDATAIKAMELFKSAGFAVGDEVGIIGFDNGTRSKYQTPPLTTVAQNGLLIGETAASLAIQKIETQSKQSVRHILPTQLIARKSCGEDRKA